MLTELNNCPIPGRQNLLSWQLSWQHHVNDLSIILNRNNTLFFKRTKSVSLIEISRSIYRICYF